jgi:hypothetical protein
MQRGNVQEDKHAAHQRQQQADGQAKTMEQRQGIEEPVGLEQVNHRQHLVDVGQQVAMAEFDALGLSFRTAREQDYRRVRRLPCPFDPRVAEQGGCR